MKENALDHMPTEEPLEAILRRFDAWYCGEVADRPPVTIMHVWREGAAPLPPKKTHATCREAMLDAEYRVERFALELERRVFIGDTFPCFRSDLAADETAVLFGGELEFNENSSWAVHNMDNPRDILDRTPDWGNPCWQAIRRMTDLSVEASGGRWITAINVHDYAADTIVALCGPENLCYAVMDDPEGVRLACDHVAHYYPQIFDDIFGRIQAGGLPTGFEGELSWGKANRLGCDFLCMVSPEMAERCVYPALEAEMAFLDRCYFHLDSEGALPHLDWLLSRPKVRGIQWVYGANRGPASKWLPVYRKIQAAGRAIELMPISLEDALDTMRHLRPEGVWIKMWALPEDQARALVAAVAKHSNWAEC
jgi:hypothetical protein